MTKLLGAALLCGGGAAVGVYKYMSLRKRARTLAGLIAALNIMRGEIRVRLTPLPEILKMLSERGDASVRGFFARVSSRMPELAESSLSSIWRGALPELCDLCGDDAAALAELGDVLGRFDAAEQESAINAAAETLGASLSLLRERLRSAPRMYIGLGLCLGAMLAAALV